MLLIRQNFEELIFEVFDEIDDLDADFWNNTVATGHPFKTFGFMRASEKAFMQRQHRYIRICSREDNKTLGLIFANGNLIDLCADAGNFSLSIVNALRLLWPKFGKITVAMLGSYETSGRHWWFSDSIPPERYMSLARHSLNMAFSHSHIRVVRDISHDVSAYPIFRAWLQDNGFHAAANYPLAVIHMNGISWHEHCLRLKSNCRKILRRMEAKYQQSNWKIVHHETDFHDIDLLYNQYLNTHKKATEFKREALPIQFFRLVGQQCRSVYSVLYDTENQVRAFIFSGVSNTIISPFIFGRDYEEDGGVNAYYILHMDLIEKFSTSHTQHIDMGITNYFLKQNFGARLQRNDIYLRFKNPIFNALLGPAMARQFSVSQPDERKVFRNDPSV